MNLNDKINLIYDFLHNDRNRYSIEPIELTKITQDDIEIPEGEVSNNILSQIFKNKLQYLFTINNSIYFNQYSDEYTSLIKISCDNNDNSYNDNLVSYVLSEFVLQNKTKNILLPILNISVDLLDLKNILENNTIPDVFEKYINKNKKKIVNLKIREKFFKIDTLRNYNKENKINYKIVLFQVIFTLAIIKQKYKYFTHNNLNLDNIFVYINKQDANNTELLLNGKMYYLPVQSFEIKITNFENAILTNTKINSDDISLREDNLLEDKIDEIEKDISDSNIKIKERLIIDNNSNIPIDNNINQLSDIIFLCKDILKENKNIDLPTKNFIAKLIDMKNNNLENLLNDNYFNEFAKVQDSFANNKSYKGNRNINSEFKSILESDNESILGQQKKLKRINKKINKLKGGGEKPSVPPYQAEKNDPFMTNDQRNVNKNRQQDAPQVRTPPVLLEQTIYDTNQKQPKPEPPPVYVPLYDNTGMATTAIPFSNVLNPVYKQPMQKVYNISLANPLHDFSTVSRIYEDIIPGDPRSFSFASTYERLELINFMRNLINTNLDGEDMNVTGGKNSLLSSIKLLDLNPYSLNNNPYNDLGANYIIYRAAYPIRYNEEKHNVQISKTATGINVRIYNISLGEMNGNTINENLNNFDFNLWRELAYYKHVKDNIIKKKISPNFITSILYKIDNMSKINWGKLNDIQNKDKLDASIINSKHNLISKSAVSGVVSKRNISLDDDIDLKIYLFADITDVIKNEWKLLSDMLKNKKNLTLRIFNIKDPSSLGLISKYNITKFPSIIFKFDNSVLAYTDKIIANDIFMFINIHITQFGKLDISVSTGESLVLLTEAPNSNIIRWASPLYESKGSLRKMIATGYHSTEVWTSILFQIMHIMYTLQENEIFFEEFSLENNIYIKDLFYEPNSLSYWIYNVNGLDYYVPNYGYLVLFDSKYSDLQDQSHYKICSPHIYPGKNGVFEGANFKDMIFDQFKEVFDPVVFTTKLRKQEGLPPGQPIIDMLTKIRSDTLTRDISSYIREYFVKYLDNRIGKLLMRSEKDIVNVLYRPLFKPGNLLVRQERFDEFRWVLYEKPDPSVPNKKVIITKDVRSLPLTESIYPYSLYSYPPSEMVSPIDVNNIIEKFK